MSLFTQQRPKKEGDEKNPHFPHGKCNEGAEIQTHLSFLVRSQFADEIYPCKLNQLEEG